MRHIITNYQMVSMMNWMSVLLLAGLGAAQPVSTPADVDRVLRDSAEGRRAVDDVRLQTGCMHGGRFVQAEVYGTGVAIWDGERQGTLSRDEVQSILKGFAKERFAKMPSAFGEEDHEPARRSVKMSCHVRFSGGGVTKDVIQLDKGEQSAALKRLARGVLGAARAATRKAVPVASLDAGLAAVAAGRLAVETLRITLRSGVAGAVAGEHGGWVLRIVGRVVEVEPDVGPRTTRNLEDAAVRDLARVLAESRFAALPSNVHAKDYAQLSVGVLGKEYAVQVRQFAGSDTQSPDITSRFNDAIAPLVALRRQ